jgi:hypothetical protein
VLLSDIPTLYYRAGNRHHRAATIGGLPIHPGRRGLSTTNNQFVHCLCTLHILTRYLLQTLSACRSQGLFWLRWKKPDAVRPFKGWHQIYYGLFMQISKFFVVWWPIAFFFLVAAAFCGLFYLPFFSLIYFLSSSVLVAPFLHPANGKGDTPPLPYYL